MFEEFFFREHGFCYFSSNQGLIWCLSNGGDEVCMSHFKEIEFGLISLGRGGGGGRGGGKNGLKKK